METDAGITGIGVVGSEPPAVQGLIEGPFSHTVTSGLWEIVIGGDPFERECLRCNVYRDNISAGRGGLGMAFSDFRSKLLAMHVQKMSGGGLHKNLGCYGAPD